MEREERDRVLAQARTHGFVDGFRCVRITAAGRRFEIANVVLWNLGGDSGQAATYRDWRFID